MRRIATALAAVLVVMAMGVGAVKVSTNWPTTSQTERLADGLRYIVSSPGTPTPTRHINSCQVAGCDQIVTTVMVRAVAYSIIEFVNT